MTETGRFVLALTAEGASDEALRSAAELAGWLRAGLYALLLEEEQALHAARLGLGLEITGGAAPRPLDPAALEASFDRLARRLERRIGDIAQAARLTSRFERRRGAPADSLLAALVTGDVVAVFEPLDAGDRMVGAHPLVRRVALECFASTLLLPRRPSPRRQPLVLLAARQDDAAALELAAHVAQAAHARLLRLELGADADAALRGAPRLLILSAEAAAGPRADALIRSAARRGTPVLTLAGASGASGASAKTIG